MADLQRDAAAMLLSVGVSPQRQQRRSSRCQAAADSAAQRRIKAEEHAPPSPFAAAAGAASAAGAGPAPDSASSRHRRRRSASSSKDWADGCEADAEDDEDIWYQASPPGSKAATPRKSAKAAGKGGRRTTNTRQRTSRFMGVGASNRAGQWQARILVHGKVTHLGYYVAEEDAARAYDRVSLAMYGNAPTNFPASQYSAADIAQLRTLDRASLQQALGVKPMQKSSRFRGVSRKKGRWEAKVMVSRKWAYRELFNSEEAAARAYDAAVWQLKPYDVAKAYVNFKEECPGPAASPRKSSKALQDSPVRAPSSAASALQFFPALPLLQTSPAKAASQRQGLARAETAPVAALSLARAGSSDHDLSGGAGGASDASRASSATRMSASNVLFSSGNISCGNLSGSSLSASGSAHQLSGSHPGASNPPSPAPSPAQRRAAGPALNLSHAELERRSPPPLPGLSLGWPAPVLAHLPPAASPDSRHAERMQLPQLQSAGSMVAGALQRVEWMRALPPNAPMSVDTPEHVHRGNDLSPPPYASAAAMQRDGFGPMGGASDAASMLGQTQAWSKDSQRLGTPQVPQLPRAPLRSGSAPQPLLVPGGMPHIPEAGGVGSDGMEASPQLGDSGPAGGAAELPMRRAHTLNAFQQPAPMLMQAPSPGHAACASSPWAPDSPPAAGTISPHLPHARMPSVPASAFGGSVLRSASMGTLTSHMGNHWATTMPQPTGLPRSASFAVSSHMPMTMTAAHLPGGMHAAGLSSDCHQDMLPELLAQQVFKQEPHDSPLRIPGMGFVHIGGEELDFGGGATHGGAGGSGGHSGFESMFDD